MKKFFNALSYTAVACLVVATLSSLMVIMHDFMGGYSDIKPANDSIFGLGYWIAILAASLVAILLICVANARYQRKGKVQ
jgi:fatty acid desaturase